MPHEADRIAILVNLCGSFWRAPRNFAGFASGLLWAVSQNLTADASPAEAHKPLLRILERTMGDLEHQVFTVPLYDASTPPGPTDEHLFGQAVAAHVMATSRYMANEATLTALRQTASIAAIGYSAVFRNLVNLKALIPYAVRAGLLDTEILQVCRPWRARDASAGCKPDNVLAFEVAIFAGERTFAYEMFGL